MNAQIITSPICYSNTLDPALTKIVQNINTEQIIQNNLTQKLHKKTYSIVRILGGAVCKRPYDAPYGILRPATICICISYIVRPQYVYHI